MESATFFKFGVYLEIILNVLSQAVTLYYFVIFSTKSSNIHRNMVSLLQIGIFYYLLSQISRLVIVLKDLIFNKEKGLLLLLYKNLSKYKGKTV